MLPAKPAYQFTPPLLFFPLRAARRRRFWRSAIQTKITSKLSNKKKTYKTSQKTEKKYKEQKPRSESTKPNPKISKKKLLENTKEKKIKCIIVPPLEGCHQRRKQSLETRKEQKQQSENKKTMATDPRHLSETVIKVDSCHGRCPSAFSLGKAKIIFRKTRRSPGAFRKVWGREVTVSKGSFLFFS